MARPAPRLLPIWHAAIVLLLAGWPANHAPAMVYRPHTGRFKDGFILRHDGKYYLFSMYTRGGEEDFRNVWLATSADGVHWQHIGPVIQDAPFNIWAMSVHRVGNRFIMNHGSFSRPGVQNVIRFWESTDLVHWQFLGHEADLFPDARWYPPDSRLDCMSVVSRAEQGQIHYYGFATGPGGFLESTDGLHWSGLPQPPIVWDSVPAPPTPPDEGGFEVGGCHEINGIYYLVGGWFNYMGTTGYGVYTLTAESPRGPFRADAAAYRLCGNSGRWVALWARFCPTESDLLVNGYMYDGYTYETGGTWLPPLKRATVDEGGHLRLGYWPGNDVLKGTSLELPVDSCSLTYPARGDTNCRMVRSPDRIEIEAQPERNSILRIDVPTAVAVLDAPLDFEQGVVVEGTLQTTCRDRRLVASSIGFYLEEQPAAGTALILHSYGRTEIGAMGLGERAEFRAEDVIGPGCAAPAGILPHQNHTFRLLVRKNMFELYLDDLLVQTFNTTHKPDQAGLIPKRLGFIAQNGHAVFEHLRCWQMDLKQ